MSVPENVVSWLRRMGYDGEISKSMISIFNSSTAFIWEELIQNLKPKQEVNHIRKNIVLNRLKTKCLERQDEFLYPIDTIEIFKKKLAYQQKLKLLKEEIQEKQSKVDRLSQNCKIKGATVEYLKTKIKGNEQRRFLLDLKQSDLEEKCLQAEQTLKEIQKVTPVEMQDSVTTQDEIKESLDKCAEKLQYIIHKSVKSLPKFPHNSFVQLATSAAEAENSGVIFSSKKSRERGKENVPDNQEAHKIKKKLCLQPPGIRIDAADGTMKVLNYSTVVSVTERPLETHLEVSEHCEIREKVGAKPKKRESLGLLPESCLTNFNQDEFLQTDYDRSSHQLAVFNESDEHFMSVISAHPNISDSDMDSISIYMKPPLNVIREHPQDKLSVENILKNYPIVKQSLDDLLLTKDRQLVYNMLQRMIEDISFKFSKSVYTGGSIGESSLRISEEEIIKLQFVHVQTELDILTQKSLIRNLLSRIENVKMHILSSTQFKADEKSLDILNNKIKQVGLDASLASIEKQIDQMNSSDIKKELQLITSQIAKVKEEIADKMSRIQSCVDEIYKVHKKLISTKDEALGPVWSLRLYKNDETWTRPLTEGLWSEEMAVFEKFPLEFSKRCIYTDPKTFYRDLCVNNYPADKSVCPDELQMISEILENPFSPPEAVLLNLIKSKIKLNVLKSMRNRSNGKQRIQHKKYTFEELLRQESYLNFAIEELQSIMYSQAAKKTLAVGDILRTTMEIWSKMPMKEFVSTNRLYDGKTYQFYDNELRALFG